MTTQAADAERLGRLATALEDAAYQLRETAATVTKAAAAAGVATPPVIHLQRVIEWLRAQAADVRRRILEAMRADRLSGGNDLLGHLVRVQDSFARGVWDGSVAVVKGAVAAGRLTIAGAADTVRIQQALTRGDVHGATRQAEHLATRQLDASRTIGVNTAMLLPPVWGWQFARELPSAGFWTATEDLAHSAGMAAPTYALEAASYGVGGAAAEIGTAGTLVRAVKMASNASSTSFLAPAPRLDPAADRDSSAGEEPGPLPSITDGEAAGRHHPAQALP